jgi:hypothetical protein
MMRQWKSVGLCLCLAFFVVTLGCTRPADVNGTWTGNVAGQNAGKTATSDVVVSLEQTSHGLTGTLKWHNATGAWELMEGNTLAIRSGSVSGNKISFIAENNLPGGTILINFKGEVTGATMKGTADLNVGSVMGGDTYLGTLDLTKK